MTCFPDKEKKPEEKSRNVVFARLMFLVGIVAFASISVIGTASADAITFSNTINWTDLSLTIQGAASTMPAIGSLVAGAINPMILVGFAGFILRFYHVLLEGISNAFRM